MGRLNYEVCFIPPTFNTGRVALPGWPGSRRHIWDSASSVASVARSTKAGFRGETLFWSLCFSKQKPLFLTCIFILRLNGNQTNRKTKTLGKTHKLSETLLPSPSALCTYRPQQALGLLDGPIAPQEAYKHHHSSHSNENVDTWGRGRPE